jgi:hypothetical protein
MRARSSCGLHALAQRCAELGLVVQPPPPPGPLGYVPPVEYEEVFYRAQEAQASEPVLN